MHSEISKNVNTLDWLYSLFVEHSALQAVVVLSLISAIGLGLGKIHICGISLGVTFVFFAGIIAGHFGLSIDPQMLNYAESFGLVIFVYALGLQVGPGFFSSFRTGGVQLNMLAVGVVLIGTVMTVLGSYGLGVSLPDMVGILCGATTNTPALGAAQQTLKQMGIEANTPALGCAVAYPLGVVGVILGILLIRKMLVRKEDLEVKEKDDVNKPYIVAFQVHNPAIFNMSIKDIAQLSYPKFVISRLWRDGNVSIPTSEKVIKEGDRLLVITSEKSAPALTVLFGEQENTDWNKEDIDWNAIDSQLVSQRIVVTRPELNGKKLGSLHLRNHYGINISRVYRSGVQLLATAELTLQLGDRLTVIGEAAAVQNVEKVLGNAVKSLKEPNLVAVFVGIVLGLALGAIPIAIPGVSTPVKLGLAGGPIIVGILIGTFGPRMHMVTYTTRSANTTAAGSHQSADGNRNPRRKAPPWVSSPCRTPTALCPPARHSPTRLPRQPIRHLSPLPRPHLPQKLSPLPRARPTTICLSDNSAHTSRNAPSSRRTSIHKTSVDSH